MEILQQVGRENIAIFGLTAEEVMDYYEKGGYMAYDTCQNDPRLQLITNQLVDGTFLSSGRNFHGIHDELMKRNDEYFVLKDFDPYLKAFFSLSELYQDTTAWGKMSLSNIAMAGHFTSDRTIAEYCQDIWHTPCDKLK